MRLARKIFTRAAANLFFNRFSRDFFLSSLVSFAFFVFLFIFLLVCLFFEIKNIYSDTHSTMRVVCDKNFFTQPISGNKTTFFWPEYNMTKIFQASYNLLIDIIKGCT